MSALEYLGAVLAVVLMLGALLLVSERRIGHRAPVRPWGVLTAPLREPVTVPIAPRARSPRALRRPPPPSGPVIDLPPWW